MRVLILSLVLFVLHSCQFKKSDKLSFEQIDVTFCNAWTFYHGYRIDDSGNAYIIRGDYQKSDNRKYFKTILSYNQLDSLSKFVNLIRQIKVDSAKIFPCTDCSVYNLIIRQKGINYPSIFYDGGDTSLVVLREFLSYLLSIDQGLTESNDTTIIIESFNRSLLPHPPPPLIHD